MASNEQSSIMIDLGSANGGLRRFETFDDLRKWVEAEFASWRWDSQNHGFGGNEYWSRFARFHNNFTNLAQRYQSNTTDASLLTQLINAISDEYRNNRLFSSQSEAGCFILDLAKTSPAQASAALEYLTRNVLVSPNHPDGLTGVIKAALYRMGITSNEAQQRALGETYTRFSNLCGQASTELDSIHNKRLSVERDVVEIVEKINAAHEKRMTELEVTSKETIARHEAQFENTKKTAQDEMTAIAKTYRDEMRTKAAVDYWDKRGRRYLAVGIGAATAFLVSLVGIGWGSYRAIPWLLAATQTNTAGTFEGISIWRYGVALILLGLSLWVLRNLMRLTLSYYGEH